MSAVFIHGVPDTFRVWDGVRGNLHRTDTIALSLPGFGGGMPANFSATKEEYVSWIISQLEQLEEPVDLVGHDWGCILALRVGCLRPDLVRSWAAGSGPVSRTYGWHPLARIWQAQGEGEHWMDEMEPESVVKAITQEGLNTAQARETVSRMDKTMKRSILQLYRSAVHVGEEWQPDLAKIRLAGLVFWGAKDVACPIGYATEMAADTGARRVLRLDSGHWTIQERPREIAQALEEHWASVRN